MSIGDRKLSDINHCNTEDTRVSTGMRNDDSRKMRQAGNVGYE